MKRPVLATTLALLFASLAHAQTVDNGNFEDGPGSNPANVDSEYVPGLGMQSPTYRGSGCPQGTVSAVISPDQRSLSVLFDQYILRASGQQARAALDCQIDIPFQVPPGYRVQVVKLDYRGFSHVPAGARSTFGAGFRFLEINGVPTSAPRVMRAKVFVGPSEENFTISSHIHGPHWSPCGQSFKLQAESRINAMTNARGDEVMTTVDSLDAVAQPAVYHLRWARCSDHPGRTHPPTTRPPVVIRPPPRRPMPPGRVHSHEPPARGRYR